jgi:hypothetical protein
MVVAVFIQTLLVPQFNEAVAVLVQVKLELLELLEVVVVAQQAHR